MPLSEVASDREYAIATGAASTSTAVQVALPRDNQLDNRVFRIAHHTLEGDGLVAVDPVFNGGRDLRFRLSIELFDLGFRTRPCQRHENEQWGTRHDRFLNRTAV